MSEAFTGMWQAIHEVGRSGETGGYHRFVWTDADHTLREWFAGEAARRGMDCQVDRNGNQWAWWGDPAAGDAVVLGSHLDSVPDGGAYDGPLGVLSAFAAVDGVRAAGVQPLRPIAVVNFIDEEGARFGVPCAGSRLLTGSLSPERARALRDRDGHSMEEVLRAAGRDPRLLGRDDVLDAVGTFVELHVEQGRDLVDRDHAVGLGSEIWPHGRYRFEFTGQANHAGTTAMDERRDPMLTYAMTVLAANKKARLGGARATFGRVQVEPNGTNAIPARVQAWLDARAPAADDVAELVRAVQQQASERARRDGTRLTVTAESETGSTHFDPRLTARLARQLSDAPVIATGAGHDAGVLSQAGIPTAMLFVRNPTGVSHSPDEFAEHSDCLAGVQALTRVLGELTTAASEQGRAP
ncbi:MAG TPA: allantoate amidohydrolase [Jiangellaceae bacterium]|nr:allantoate amidohydrolase [Jiangellaceae bacterium]